MPPLVAPAARPPQSDTVRARRSDAAKSKRQIRSSFRAVVLVALLASAAARASRRGDGAFPDDE